LRSLVLADAFRADIPVETLEVKETVHAVEWEPNGTRLAIISGDGPRPDVSFYQLNGKKIAHIRTPYSSIIHLVEDIWSE
jgi:uncharacterized protein with WD repeat